jgi:hypothetical protein
MKSLEDCWPEVSTHPEGPATGHHITSIFELIPPSLLRYYPVTSYSYVLLMHPSQPRLIKTENIDVKTPIVSF